MTRAQYEDYKKIEGDADTIFVQCSATGYLLPLALCPLFTRRYPGYATAALLSLGCGTFGCQVKPPFPLRGKTPLPKNPTSSDKQPNAVLVANRRSNNPLPPQKSKRNLCPLGPHQTRLQSTNMARKPIPGRHRTLLPNPRSGPAPLPARSPL